MSEFDDFLASRTLSERTKKNYLSQYEKVTNHLSTTVGRANERELIAAVRSAASTSGTFNPRSAWTYSNVVSQILKMRARPREEFEKARTEWKRAADYEQPDKVIDEVAELPTEEEVVEYIRTLHGTTYLLNRLMYEYGLRNKDMQLKVVGHDYPEDVKNWFNWRNGKLHIGEYKTRDVYGSKNIVVKAKRLLHEAEKVAGEWLVPPDVEDKDLSHYIAPKTYKGMGQSKYFKVRLMATSSAKERMLLGETRGTSIGNINRFYNGKRYVGDS